MKRFALFTDIDPDRPSAMMEDPTGEYIRVDELLEWLKGEHYYYNDPSTYQDRDYYLRMDAKADMLEEVISYIEVP